MIEDELPAVFYNSVEEYAMPEKRSYKEVLANLETHVVYINNHLQNIDKHLERQNDKLIESAKIISRNSAWICALKYAVYIIIAVLIGAITATRIGLW